MPDPQATKSPDISHPRKICVVVASRANYARIKSVLTAVKDRPDTELQVIAAASTLLERFGTAVDFMEDDGFKPDATIRLIIEGENPTTMAKSTGLGLLELPTVFEVLKPDIVVTVADRFETIATAIAAAYMNLPVAHTQGGEVSGSIDESVRHAVTKLSHLHFPATELSAQRIIAMGENPETVFNVGCPSIDLVSETDLTMTDETVAKVNATGAGGTIDLRQPYILMMQHPVTTEYGQSFDQVNETLEAVASLGTQALVFFPNVDAGSEQVAKGIRMFREKGKANGFHFFRNLPAPVFLRLMANCACMVGNSSAALREGAYVGTPAVTVGSRQRNRERGANVIEVENEAGAIAAAVQEQVSHGPYPSDPLFGDGTAGGRIAEILATAQPRIQKQLHYDVEELLEQALARVK